MDYRREKALASTAPMDERDLRVLLAAEQEHARALADRLADCETQLAQKDLLLKEVNHRIKNSLQLVASLLRLHGLNTTSASVRQHFDTAIARVMAISSVHERLYRIDRVERVEFGEYLRSLCHDLAGNELDSEPVWKIEVRTEEIELSAESALPLGLIANELVTNACKHAYPEGTSGRIRVELQRLEGDRVRLTVSDEGIGKLGDEPAPAGLGTRLVQTLTRQIRGKLETTLLEPGLAVTVTFPIKTDAP